MRKDEIQALVKKLIDRFAGREEVDPSLLSRLHQIEERAEISGKHSAVQTKGSGEISGKFGAVKGSNNPEADTSAMAHWSSTPDKFMRQRMREIENLAGGHKGFDIDPMNKP